MLISLGMVALGAVACGGDTSAFGPGTTATGGSATGGGGSTGTGGTATGGGGASSTSTGTAGSGGSSSGVGGSGGDPQPVQISCGNTTCVTGEICCIALGPTSTPPHCESEQVGCGNEEIEMECDGPADCPGSQVCCVQIVISGPPPPDISDVECEASCQGQDQYELCESTQDCTSGTCQPLQMMPMMDACQ